MTTTNDPIFTILDQDGPFASRDNAPPGSPFSKEARTMAAALSKQKQQTKYRVIRNQIFDLLDVHSFAEINALIANTEKRKRVTNRAYALLGNMFGIEGSSAEIVAAISSYSRTADGVIRYLRGKVLANFSSHIEMTNEIDVIASPVDLLLIIFDQRYHKKARFEAKRKLYLMNLAGAIDQRERETDIETKFARFLNFLNQHVWTKESKIGELELVNVLSSHRQSDFSCEKIEFLSHEEAASVKPNPGQKLTLLKRRRFPMGKRDIPIYVSIRKKQSEAKVLKLLRKGEENPAVAVDDELGLMGVLDNIADVKAFQKHLTNSAKEADSFMVLEDISDSLISGKRNKSNIGSSEQTRMLKFFARLGGMRVEFIVHTNESYLNYIYQRDVAHDEYEVKRIFDSGVTAQLFPEEIYFLPLAMAREHQLHWFRKQLESHLGRI